MSIETFTPPMNPDWGLTSDVRADVYEGKVGDGYVVRRPKGLNYLKESWDLSWSNLDKAQAGSMYSWLKSRLKLTPFMWTHPTDGVTYKVICSKVSHAASDVGIYQVMASFEQDFNL